ncbi:MAG: right-handed parallel beta-helix repeat-containing protein, partial [Deltaproteobacteria bacterium]|nr:right-handed parallel beta-helix repeat-containing protein [Deltaproteobacteria bacterium]
VVLEGLTLEQGKAASGGGLMIQGRGEVLVRSCTFSGNEAGYYGGGAIYANAGRLRVERSTFSGNRGNQGGAVLLDQAMIAEFEECRFEQNRGSLGGALRVKEAVIASFSRCIFQENHSDGPGSVINLNGTSSRAPEVKIAAAMIDDGDIFNGAEYPGKLVVESSQLPATSKGSTGWTDGGGNRYGEE